MSSTQSAAERELPFQPDSSSALSSGGWMIVLAGLLLGYLLVFSPWTPRLAGLGVVLRGVLFVSLPLLALRVAAGRRWLAALHVPTPRDVQWTIGGSVLTMAASITVALLLLNGTSLQPTSNPFVERLTRMPPLDFVALLLSTLPQLFGEEVLSILPLLGVLALLRRHTQIEERRAVALASLASCVLFAAAHLPTYGWNVVQCFSVIGVARLMLNFAYLRTRNLWVPFGAHVLADWSYFTALVYGR